MDEFHFRNVASLPDGGLILDLGGNRIAKRGLFDIERYDLRVIYANLSTAKRPHVQAEAEHLPFMAGKFDAVICFLNSWSTYPSLRPCCRKFIESSGKKGPSSYAFRS